MDQEARRRIAMLESKIDFLEAELFYLHDMLLRCGFPHGIETLKETVEELMVEEPHLFEEKPSFDL